MQDYLFQSRLLVCSPRVAQPAIADGLVTLVDELEAAADAALKEASTEEQKEAERTFLGVARLERGFWEMAYGGGWG